MRTLTPQLRPWAEDPDEQLKKDSGQWKLGAAIGVDASTELQSQHLKPKHIWAAGDRLCHTLKQRTGTRTKSATAGEGTSGNAPGRVDLDKLSEIQLLMRNGNWTRPRQAHGNESRENTSVRQAGNTGVREQEEKVMGRCWTVPLGANSEADGREKNSAEKIMPGTAPLQSTKIRAKSWIEKSLVAKNTGAERRTQATHRPENTSRRTKPATVMPEPKKLSCSKGPERSPTHGLEISPKLEAGPQIWTEKIISAQKKMNSTKGCNTSFSIEIKTRFTSNPRRSPPSLPRLETKK
jgi:hypothetical protein